MKAKKRHNLHVWQNRAYKHNLGEKDPELKCAICGDDRIITVDHIVPAHFIQALETSEELALNMEENFQWLCKYHNQMKASRFDAKDPRTYAIMRKVLEEAERYHLLTPKEDRDEIR